MKRSITIGLLLSLALHLIVVGVMTVYKLQPTVKPVQETISFEILDQEPAKTEVKTVKKEKQKLENNQIVEQDQSLNKETPDDARFLSAQNQKVLKQTQAANHGEFQNKKTKTTFLL